MGVSVHFVATVQDGKSWADRQQKNEQPQAADSLFYELAA